MISIVRNGILKHSMLGHVIACYAYLCRMTRKAIILHSWASFCVSKLSGWTSQHYVVISPTLTHPTAVDWGGRTVVMTDLDGAKRFFRKRGWIREFFERHGARAGDTVTVEEVAPCSYRVALQRCLA